MLWIITGGIIYLILVVTLGVMSIRKGHWVMFIVGFFLPFFWLIGALMPSRRLAYSASQLQGERCRGACVTNQYFHALPAAKRRRLIFRAVLRSVLAAVVLVVLYYVLPLDRPWDANTVIRLLIGIVVFAGVMVWEVRAIAGSRYPGLRAAGALGLILPLYLVLFASTYFVMERASAASFTEPLSPRTRCTSR